MTATIPVNVLQRWRRLTGSTARHIAAGLINDTYLLDCGSERFVMQRLHPVHDALVNRDIQAVTMHLRKKGLITPTIIPCDDGELCCKQDDRIWRLLSHEPGRSYNAIASPRMAYEAGHIAAEFHTALGDFEYDYQSGRMNVHDTPKHLARLQDALVQYADHRLYPKVDMLAHCICAISEVFTEIDDLPQRHAHGDLKISNILFDDEGAAVCLIDLDTVNRMPWPLEMGDALRSWCNPRTEDQLRADLDLDVLDAVMAGYAAAAPGWLTALEKESLIGGLARICLELSARFLTDALQENYFGWDDRIYPTRGDHNLARGMAMAALYDNVMEKRAAAEQIVHQRLSGM